MIRKMGLFLNLYGPLFPSGIDAKAAESLILIQRNDTTIGSFLHVDVQTYLQKNNLPNTGGG
jgi:hypothetical protein